MQKFPRHCEGAPAPVAPERSEEVPLGCNPLPRAQGLASGCRDWPPGQSNNYRTWTVEDAGPYGEAPRSLRRSTTVPTAEHHGPYDF